MIREPRIREPRSLA
uniref:Unknown protein 21 (Fragments) n=1 Tax=Pseudotsuga menziesii TaxID=3357 RepID=UP21_PSEMZ|nr:RecName: Full=Unknown protein 21 [Pseudotsuga menziesii]